MFLTKKEAAEMMLRPMPMPPSIHEKILSDLMHYTPSELITEFKKSTDLILMPAGSNLFSIKY